MGPEASLAVLVLLAVGAAGLAWAMLDLVVETWRSVRRIKR